MTRTAFKVVPAVPLEKLLLDTKNPRIRSGEDQSDCIERLLRKPKQFLALAKDIATNGLSTAPILVEPVKGKKFVVWDGNRRITALKLLNDPALCRDRALRTQLAAVAAKAVFPIPAVVDVLSSSDHNALLQEVLARHAGAMDGAGQLNWDALLRTMFLLGHQAAPKDYRLTGLLLMWAEEHGIAVDDDFPITTVHRFLNKQNLERLGFREKDGVVESTSAEDSAVRVAERIVQDFGSGKVTVDNVFTVGQQGAYITSLLTDLGLLAAPTEGKSSSGAREPAGGSGAGGGDSAADRAGRGGRGSSDPQAPDDEPSSDGGGGAKKPVSKRSPVKPDWDRKYVPRTRFKPAIPDAMWKPWEVLKELRRTETEDHAIAAASLFRIFFELSTRAYMKRHRLADKGEMHKSAQAVATDMRAHGRLDEGELTAANRRFKDKSQAEALLQYATLNDFMHSFKHLPDRQSLHVLWTEVEAYLEACWDDTRRP
ncbi:hypothetical protein ASD86_06560 [Lysobacter sp. Root690]|nr:hypothetical protein ASD86_06560 [Lysobacter sp. Root690]